MTPWCSLRRLSVVACLSLGACAVPLGRQSAQGYAVGLQLAEGGRVGGELVAVSAESLWIRPKGRTGSLHGVAMASVASVRIDRDGPRKAKLWPSALLGLGSWLLLASPRDHHAGKDIAGVVALATLIGMLLEMGEVAEADALSALEFSPPDAEALRPYARFPLGLPSGFR